MSIFKRVKIDEAETAKVDRTITIEYLRQLSAEDYDKVIKIVNIYRQADYDARVVEYGSKKAANEAMKANEDVRDADEALAFEEMN